MNKYYHNLGLLFDDVALENAIQPALCYPEQYINYKDLSEWAQRLGVFLLSKGVQPGDVIAIGSNKKFLTYALMLASIRLGVAYVNIDVTAPLARNLPIIEVSQTEFLFYDEPSFSQRMYELAHAGKIQAIELISDELPEVTPRDREKQKELMRKIDGSTIAYVMFTSGSTGIPKGVAVTHQNVLHFISWGHQYFQIKNHDNFANLSPLYFDNSVFDFYVGLFSGASLSPIPRELLTKPYELVAHVGKMECTIWFSVPSLLIYLVAMKAMEISTLSKLRHIIFGGEGYPKAELKKLYDLFNKQATLVNVYGPTECTCISSAYKLSEDDFKHLNGLPSLGKLNPNFDYLILDEHDKEACEGELCLLGPNVAAGYFNELERSAKTFITLTDPRRFMKRMYRTGDLVQETEGMLHFIGRKDNQVKHMGYRIELEEIEHALVSFMQINQAAVVYHRTNVAYGKLIGFVASAEDIDEQVLLGNLTGLLPTYMIPSRIIVRKELPKNPNGKVDRQQLLLQCAD
ncbi:amino acid adenylation domain-containing protein [Legionella fallonii]|uniref:D-alanine--poly(Phosphoribitol) ligase subunit 1 n=1 Tax=Legionella fallonii LLAP-10 TaxID=1212491 RepID=A0A098G7B8_9GAMM|nr:amino acid adenylation domain-containing protein [Legionella fallonii]CEG58352.1 D-alanine--poly(Phosphoribitol) ligase subunit 1 [Legionella fallonii LLAP-10]